MEKQLFNYQYNKFQEEVALCTDKQLREIYNIVVDEMDRRSWEKRSVADLSQKMSKLENDWGMV